MTTSHCEPISEAQLTFQYVSANDPDAIGVEVYHEGNVLFGIDMYDNGRLTITFEDAENAEFDFVEFKHVLDRCQAELSAWKGNLITAGSAWEQQ